MTLIIPLAKWKEIRELRNAVNNVYEDDADILFQALNNMIENAPYLHSIFKQMRAFVKEAYIDPLQTKC